MQIANAVLGSAHPTAVKRALLGRISEGLKLTVFQKSFAKSEQKQTYELLVKNRL